MKNQKSLLPLALSSVLILMTTVGCSAPANPPAEPSQISDQGATAEDVEAICGTVEKLRKGWFSGATMDDFTMHIPTLAAQLATVSGEDEEGVIVVARVLSQDLGIIAKYTATAPATDSESAEFTDAVDNFPLRSETIVNLCK